MAIRLDNTVEGLTGYAVPRTPGVIKPLLKVGGTGTFLGRTYIILGLPSDDEAEIAYTDNTGEIHLLILPQAVL